MPKYTQVFNCVFSIPSSDPQGKDLTAPALRADLLRHLYQLTDEELLNACGVPQACLIQQDESIPT